MNNFIQATFKTKLNKRYAYAKKYDMEDNYKVT